MAVGLGAEFEFSAVDGVGFAFALDELALPAFRANVELDRSEEFLPAVDAGAVPARLLALAFLLVLAFLFDADVFGGRGKSRAALARAAEFPPGTVNTTSRRLERCSTCAVAPGWSLNETTVLSPLRCAFTSPNPRPRSASARATSAAGIFT